MVNWRQSTPSALYLFGGSSPELWDNPARLEQARNVRIASKAAKSIVTVFLGRDQNVSFLRGLKRTTSDDISSFSEERIGPHRFYL